MKLYDCIVIGGGPAGLSAAIYLARFQRHVFVIDKGVGRSTTHEINKNYLGFPDGIAAKTLRSLGKRQARRFGALFTNDFVTDLKKENNHFTAVGKKGRYAGKTVIIATGVVDIFPTFTNVNKYIGKSLFWCITCDGRKARNKRVVVLGNTNAAACTATQVTNFTNDVVFVTNQDSKETKLSKLWRDNLQANNIPLYEASLASVSGNNGQVVSMQLDDGTRLMVDIIFSQQGALPNASLAKDIGLRVNKDNYIEVTSEQRSNVPFVYAAGDVTQLHSHQIVTASHEGSMAAQAANYDLYNPNQRED